MALSERMGRPRDPAVDQRIEQAAIEVFARRGWAGFSVESVARSAGVGKASVYLRWDSREDLLADAIGRVFHPLTAIDSGEVREDFRLLALGLLELYAGRNALAARRMTVEADAIPSISRRWRSVRESQVRSARDIVRRAIARGELAPGTSPALVLDTLCGAAINHAIAVPEHLRSAMVENLPTYAEKLVDFVLAAARTTQ